MPQFSSVPWWRNKCLWNPVFSHLSVRVLEDLSLISKIDMCPSMEIWQNCCEILSGIQFCLKSKQHLCTCSCDARPHSTANASHWIGFKPQHCFARENWGSTSCDALRLRPRCARSNASASIHVSKVQRSVATGMQRFKYDSMNQMTTIFFGWCKSTTPTGSSQGQNCFFALVSRSVLL